jgi:hypothetical protein
VKKRSSIRKNHGRFIDRSKFDFHLFNDGLFFGRAWRIDVVICVNELLRFCIFVNHARHCGLPGEVTYIGTELDFISREFRRTVDAGQCIDRRRIACGDVSFQIPGLIQGTAAQAHAATENQQGREHPMDDTFEKTSKLFDGSPKRAARDLFSAGGS